MEPGLNWTLIDFALRPDNYLHAISVFVGEWRRMNPNSFDILLMTVPPTLVWCVYKTPWTWDESILKRIFESLKIPWKKEVEKNVSP